MADTLISEALVTSENVAGVAEALTGRGEKVSVRAIIRELGGGSPNAVLNFLNLWKKTKVDAQESPPVTHIRELVPLDSVPEIAGLVDQTTNTMLSVVGRIQTAERKSAEDRVTSLMAAHLEELAAKDRQQAESLAALQDVLDDTRSALDEAKPYMAEALDLRLEADRLMDMKNGLLGDKARLEVDLVSANSTLKQTMETLATAVSALGRAEGEALAWRMQVGQVQDELRAVRQEAVATLDAVRQEGAAAVTAVRQEGIAVADRLRGELDGVRADLATSQASAAGAAIATQAVERRLGEAHADLSRERAEHAGFEQRLAALMERAIKAEAEIAKPQTTKTE